MPATPPSSPLPPKPRVVLRPVRPRPEGQLHDAVRLEAVRMWLRAPRGTAQLERIVRWATLTVGGEAGLCCVVSKNHVRIVATHNLALSQFKVEGFAHSDALLPEFTALIDDPLVLERLTVALGLHFSPVALRVVPMRVHGAVIGAICVFESAATPALAPAALQLLYELALEAAGGAADLAPVAAAQPVVTEGRQAAVATLGQHLPLLLFSVDAGGRFAHVEGRVLELLELEASQLLGQSAFDVWRDLAFLELLRRSLGSADRAVTHSDFTWREQRFDSWVTPCESGLAGIALMLESTSVAVAATKRSRPTELALVELPNLTVALEFVNGVGGLSYFTAEMHSDAAWPGERLVLSGRGVRIVVERGDLSDLKPSERQPVA